MRTLLAGLAIAGAAGTAAAQEEWEGRLAGTTHETQEAAGEVRDRLEDISLLNLLNGLNLSGEQADRVVALALFAGRYRDETADRHGRTLREFAEALAQLRTRLLSCGHVPPELEARAAGLEQRLNEIRRKASEGYRAMEGRLRGILTPGQVEVVEKFNPCLIPPRDLKDPIRVGQVESETADIEEHLETLRTAPGRAFPAVARGFAELLTSFEEVHLGKWAPAEREAEIARLGTLFERARKLPDVEFETGKAALALEAIRPLHAHQEKAQELTEFFLKASGGLAKLGKFLLNPRVAALLEERRGREPGRSAPADLGRIEPAESCAGCGRPEPPRAAAAAPRPGDEPRFSEVAAWLGLDEAQSARARAAFRQGQRDLLATLGEPREDGRNMVAEVFRALLAGDHAKLLATLGERVPGADETYGARIEGLKLALEDDLRASLAPAQFRRWRSAGLDPFKVKANR